MQIFVIKRSLKTKWSLDVPSPSGPSCLKHFLLYGFFNQGFVKSSSAFNIILMFWGKKGYVFKYNKFKN